MRTETYRTRHGRFVCRRFWSNPRRPIPGARFGYFFATALLALISAPLALGAESPILDIKRLTIAELMDIDVYSASRRAEPAKNTPSAVYVLTGEDIRRSHVTSIPEALRLVPGVDVARVDANKWAVSIRGFNGRTTNKLLVLIDGRSIYDPLFSGVLWEARDVVLEDVDRIEVIRGPGGTLWGANAINGVINIITKHARDTQGGLIAAGAGTEERAFGTARYGWQPSASQFARIYAKSFKRGTGFSPTGNSHDEAQMNQTGFRWDWDASARDAVRVSGDFFDTDAGERNSATATQDVNHRGGNLLASWTRQLSATDSMRAQVYYDRLELDNVQLGEKRDTYDVEYQQIAAIGARHLLIWGGSYRNTSDNIRNGPLIAIDPSRRTDNTVSGFIQDTITLVPDKVQLTLGTKVENNDYSGTEWQPNIRFAWTPDTQQTYWTAYSRAVRVPSRLEADLVFGGTRLGDNVQAEHVDAYEFGYRRLVTASFSYDVAAFYNAYDDLATVEQGFQFQNKMSGHTRGVEVAGRWQLASSWRLDVAYTYLQMKLAVDASSIAVNQPQTIERSNPQHQLAVRSAQNIARNLEFDATLRFVDDLPQLGVPAYTTLDLGLTWFMGRAIELSLVGQNLLDSHHPEQRVVDPNTGVATGTEVQRGVYTKLTWRF